MSGSGNNIPSCHINISSHDIRRNAHHICMSAKSILLCGVKYYQSSRACFIYSAPGLGIRKQYDNSVAVTSDSWYNYRFSLFHLTSEATLTMLHSFHYIFQLHFLEIKAIRYYIDFQMSSPTDITLALIFSRDEQQATIPVTFIASGNILICRPSPSPRLSSNAWLLFIIASFLPGENNAWPTKSPFHTDGPLTGEWQPGIGSLLEIAALPTNANSYR